MFAVDKFAHERDVSLARILIVDDESINRLLLRQMLQKDGYEVLEAVNGEEAVAVYIDERPDIVLMDVMMPVMDGYQAATRIKELSATRFCPILFVTALAEEESLAQCVASGGDDFLIKPYNRTLLRAKMKALERIRDLYLLSERQKDALSEHNVRLQAEHDVAQRVFNNILHSGSLDAENIKYLLAPMAIANGDMLLSEFRPDGTQQVLVGDFTGHGLSAAIGSLPATDIFLSMTRKGFSVGRIAAEINLRLKKRLPPELFLSACLLEFDWANGCVRCWNGGLPDVIIYRPGEGIAGRLASRQLPLGILSEEDFDSSLEDFSIAAGDRIYSYSDGVLETTNSDGMMFGAERLAQCFSPDQACGVLFEDICARLDRFRGETDQSDDITLIEVKCPDSGTLAAVKEGIPAQPVLSAWSTVCEFGPDVLRNDEPMKIVGGFLRIPAAVKEHKSRIYTVIAELFGNALDHGLLGLDSSMKCSLEGFTEYYARRETGLAALDRGSIRIELKFYGDEIRGGVDVLVEDSGPGFDFEHALSGLEDAEIPCRRGMALVRSLCTSLEYRERGNVVQARYDW